MALSHDANEKTTDDLNSAELREPQIQISIDLVAAAKDFLNFLRSISGLPQLHGGFSAIQAVRRYLNCWMPLLAEEGSHAEKPLLPPLDVQWVWLCHCLKPKAYQDYCKRYHGKLIDGPIFLESSIQDDALQKSTRLWNESCANEPFEMELSPKDGQSKRRSHASHSLRPFLTEEKEILESIQTQIRFYNQVSQQYMQHEDFLNIAKRRYTRFLYMLQKVEGGTPCIPTSDIQLMWKCHQTFPADYAHDTRLSLENQKDVEVCIQDYLSNTTTESLEQTSRTWELLFGQPYERAGAVWPHLSNTDEAIALEPLSSSIPITINWHHQMADINSKHSFLQPRYVLEVCMHIKSTVESERLRNRVNNLCLRVRTLDACKTFKHEISVENFNDGAVWHKLLCMQCEAGTTGIVVDLISNDVHCLVTPFFSGIQDQFTINWQDLQKDLLLESEKVLTKKNRNQVLSTWVILTSITPPAPAPYLLKALLDCVTDDSGAMISKKLLRLNKGKPQEGRWMTRTVLDHAGRECFIIRTRVATGVWRNRRECPVGVDWNERIIRIHGGGWNYVSGSIGIASEEVLATATPLDDEREQYKMKWSFSTGETLTIQMPIENLEWERHLRFSLKGNRFGVIRLLNGRHMRYEVLSSVPEEEEGFVTLIRYTSEARQGRATALFNWKLLAMEVLPEEDVILVLLICIATNRAVADLGAKTLRNVYRRKCVKRMGTHKNCGSVVMGGQEDAPTELSYWYANPEEVLDVNLAEMDNEEVLPLGASEQMYRGTSWLYAGSMKGLYKMASKGSFESFSYDVGDHHHAPVRFSSQTKLPIAASH